MLALVTSLHLLEERVRALPAGSSLEGGSRLEGVSLPSRGVGVWAGTPRRENPQSLQRLHFDVCLIWGKKTAKTNTRRNCQLELPSVCRWKFGCLPFIYRFALPSPVLGFFALLVLLKGFNVLHILLQLSKLGFLASLQSWVYPCSFLFGLCRLTLQACKWLFRSREGKGTPV